MASFAQRLRPGGEPWAELSEARIAFTPFRRDQSSALNIVIMA